MSKESLESLFASVHQERKKFSENQAKKDEYLKKSQAIRRLLMPCQARLEEDTSRRVSVRAARRTGKSTGALLVIVIRCLENASSDWVIVGLTRASVKRNYWADFQRLNQSYELGLKFQHQELTATFPNGSKIYFVGADNASEAEKLRGGKYDGVLIDECKSYAASMFEELIQDVIEPALLDRQGQLIVIGTPGDQLVGPFYLATAETPVAYYDNDNVLTHYSNKPYMSGLDVPATWSLHPWTLRDNVTLFHRKGKTYTLWDEALKLKREKRWADDHPTWCREYLGQWVANNLKYVYRFKPQFHSYRPLHDTHLGLPEKDSHGFPIYWRTVTGWDFGSKDGTAAVVWAFADNFPGLWEVYSERVQSSLEKVLNVSFIANWYQRLEDKYGPFEGSVGDMAGLATMVLDTLATEHQVYIEAAEKTEKNDHIELFNDEMDAGLIHIRENSPLAKELPYNLWLAKTIGTPKRVEDPATPNDICDGGLYGWRLARHKMAKSEVPDEPMFTPEWYQIRQMEEMKQAAKDHDAARQITLDRNWWES